MGMRSCATWRLRIGVLAFAALSAACGSEAPGAREAADDALGAVLEARVTTAFDPAATRAALAKVAHYQLAAAAPAKDIRDNGWIQSTFYAGLVAAYQATGDAAFLTATKQWAERHAWGLHADKHGSRFADNQT